jgi:5-methylcytosine-specific restriction endonuclease McrA
MKLIDGNLLDEFRHKTHCELCWKRSYTGLDPHHLMSKGAGRVDIRCNLASLCRQCHNIVHANPDELARLFAIVARREGMTVQDIKDRVHKIRRTPKE